MCVLCLARMAQVYLYSNSANALDFSYSRMSIQAVVFNRGIARTQSMGANSQIVTIAFESYLLHVCVVACPDGTGLPVSQQCKCTRFLLLTNVNPSCCVQSRDCTHTIDGRELTNRHNSIRELLIACVCCCLPGWHRVTCIATVQMHSISPTHECQSKLLCSIA